MLIFIIALVIFTPLILICIFGALALGPETQYDQDYKNWLSENGLEKSVDSQVEFLIQTGRVKSD